MSTRNAAPRPIMSAPGPRAGSSGRCGRSGSSPRTVLVASAGSVPGIDPTPVATPANCCSVTAATLAAAGLSVPRGSMTGMYAERAPAADLAGHLRCSWTRRTGGSGSVLPDGCLDLMWIGGELVVAGPDTVATQAELPAGVEIAAVRFRPGAAPAVLGVPASALRDQRVPLAELWPDAPALARRVGAAADRVAVLEDAVRRRLADAPPVDPVAVAVGRRLAASARVGRGSSPSWRGGPGCPSGSCTAGA